MTNLILAMTLDGAIGRNGDLILHIPSDLKRFKQLTMGHPVIMGRKTWDSLPKRPLPGRQNVVISRNPDFRPEGAVVVNSPREAIDACTGEEPFVIGGGKIYELFVPFADKIYLTEIEKECPDADVRLSIDFERDWNLIEESEPEETAEGVRYRYKTYIRKRE